MQFSGNTTKVFWPYSHKNEVLHSLKQQFNKSHDTIRYDTIQTEHTHHMKQRYSPDMWLYNQDKVAVPTAAHKKKSFGLTNAMPPKSEPENVMTFCSGTAVYCKPIHECKRGTPYSYMQVGRKKE
jgi:hypothetical protein